jgi:hypothetical protein
MSTVEYTWRDSELHNKPLRALNWTGARLARFGPELPSLKPSSVIAAAAKKAGSDDFGSDSYREPLEVYLRACEDEAELTTFGRLLISKMLAGALANRIELHRWSKEHPEVREGRIERPWIIVGLPRTGTSLLSIQCRGRSCNGRRRTPCRRRPWRRRRRIRASLATPRTSTVL